ncbi:DUF5672 family protein [Dysgonomonas sp. 511]|uniref:DUF5672 family protein n=1 Tax=Dysgonomonas sp. 511 TaxID=2302930 RepID=UPI0013CF6E3D|nr:DUF5672 family protein [Dysgonomonas sp. 511]NDV78521.1 hypothetical protein [Dysgonomonas sp. 511]
MKQSCLVIFPVYKPLDGIEQMAFRQAIAMTEGFERRFIAPHSFVFDDSFQSFSGIETERFDDSFFAGLQGYNKLMLNIEFYKRFESYRYILIHQADAYLFTPRLRYWCNKGYDYVGAPWYEPRKLEKYNIYKFAFDWLKPFIRREKLLRWRHFNNVGNGGLSLRNVETFIKVLSKVDKALLQMYIDNESHFFHEDIFWSLEAPGIYKPFKKPGWEEALAFSFENQPARAFEYMKEVLPFGCHAYIQCDPLFWERYIPFKENIARK